MSIPQILSTQQVFDFRTLEDTNGKRLKQGINMFRRRFRNGDYTGDWTFASRNHRPEQVIANAVVIVARVGNRALITQEYRVPLQGIEIGFPAGLLNREETPERGAVRELREETGLYATRVYESLTTPLLPSSAGLSDEAVQIVFVEAEGRITDDLCEPGESIYAELMDIGQISKLIFNRNNLISGKAYGIMYAWWLSGAIQFQPSAYLLSSTLEVKWANKDTPQEEFEFSRL